MAIAVRGEAAKANQHADQHGHWQRENQNRSERAEEEGRCFLECCSVLYYQTHQPDKLWHEENEREHDKTEQGIGYNFAANVSIENAHRRARNSSMSATNAMESHSA
jgi:hypothetical protein